MLSEFVKIPCYLFTRCMWSAEPPEVLPGYVVAAEKCGTSVRHETPLATEGTLTLKELNLVS